jgi:hypothetical protein
LLYLESTWNIIIGGYDGNVNVDSVELHNWKTGQQCFTTNLPYGVTLHSGVVMEGFPAFCGGLNTNYISTCLKFVVAQKQWTQVLIFSSAQRIVLSKKSIDV